MDVVRVMVVFCIQTSGCGGEEICRTSSGEARETHAWLLRPDRRVFEKQESGPENSRSGAR